MIKGSENRQADHAVDNLFVDRWSPRAMSGEEVAQADLLVLFEAARWAPSSYNNQPWRILYAHRGSKHWSPFFDLLMDVNKVWARNAGCNDRFLSRKRRSTLMVNRRSRTRLMPVRPGKTWPCKQR